MSILSITIVAYITTVIMWWILSFEELSETNDINKITIQDVIFEGGCLVYTPLLNTILLIMVGISNIIRKHQEYQKKEK